MNNFVKTFCWDWQVFFFNFSNLGQKFVKLKKNLPASAKSLLALTKKSLRERLTFMWTFTPDAKQPKSDVIDNLRNRPCYAGQNCIVSWHPLRNNLKFTTNVALETLNRNPRFFKCASGHLMTSHLRLSVKTRPVTCNTSFASHFLSRKCPNFKLFQISLLTNRA